MAVARRAKKASGKRKGRPPGKLTGAKINGFPIRRMSVADLKKLVADYNPREIKPKALDGLKASVDEFGLPQAIVWNVRTQRIVGGHQRVKTLPEDSETDVVQVDLTDIQERALNVAFNNPFLMGEWTADLNSLLDTIENGLPDLMERMNLDELRVEAPDLGELAPPGEFPAPPTPSESTDHECPKCGYSW